VSERVKTLAVRMVLFLLRIGKPAPGNEADLNIVQLLQAWLLADTQQESIDGETKRLKPATGLSGTPADSIERCRQVSRLREIPFPRLLGPEAHDDTGPLCASCSPCRNTPSGARAQVFRSRQSALRCYLASFRDWYHTSVCSTFAHVSPG
jgi:hypothetical protein